MEQNDHGRPSTVPPNRAGAGGQSDQAATRPQGADLMAHSPKSGAGASYDAETMQGLPGDTPVFERGRTADLDGNFDDEIGLPTNAGFETGSTYAASDDGEYGMDRSGADPVTGQADASILAQMGMGVASAAGSHGGFDDEDERGQPSAPGYDGDDGDPVSTDGLSGAGASYAMTDEGSDETGLPAAEVGVGSGFANPEEPGFSNDEDTLIDDAALDAGGEEMPQPIPGNDIPSYPQPGYGDDGNDVEVEIPVPAESDIPGSTPTYPGTNVAT